LQRAVRKKLPMVSVKPRSNEKTTISDTVAETIREGLKAMTASILQREPGGGRLPAGKRSRSASRESRGSKRDEAMGVCFDWMKGQCARGENCRFAHNTKSPRSASPAATVQFKSIMKK
jgi:hypothetical protein